MALKMMDYAIIFLYIDFPYNIKMCQLLLHMYTF